MDALVTEADRINAADGVGADLRALRKARGMTLVELSEASGRSVGWLSQVERGISTPTIDDLRRLAHSLSSPISIFFGDPDAPEDERGYVVRERSGRSLGDPAGGLTETLLSPDLGGAFEIVRSIFDPSEQLSDVVQRSTTEEAGVVVSGAFELWIDGKSFILGEGDAFRIRGEPFRWRNPGARPAVVIWVISPPIY